MSTENPTFEPKKELSETKKKLLELERSGEYVFHGSAYEGPLELQQAYNYKKGLKEKDDKPAIHASPVVDYAIMMALINKKNCSKGFHSSARLGEKGLELKIDQKSYDQLDENSYGWIHIFDKDKFTERSLLEYISYQSITPTYVIKVKKEDLVDYLEIIPTPNKSKRG